MDVRNKEITFHLSEDTYGMLLELQDKYKVSNIKVFITKNLIYPYIRMMKISEQEHPKRPIPHYPLTCDIKDCVRISILLTEDEYKDYRLLVEYQLFKDVNRQRLMHSQFLTSIITFKYKKMEEKEEKKELVNVDDSDEYDDDSSVDVDFDLSSLIMDGDKNGIKDI